MILLKIFGEWDTGEVVVRDPGLKAYINFQPRIVFHHGGRHAKKQFKKSEVSIVERLVNKLMRSGPGARRLKGKVIRGGGATGKKMKAYKIVQKALKIVHERMKKNPIQVLVDAIQHSAPREETTRITYGGITYYVAVDSAPQRRLDIALRNLAAGAYAASFSNPKPIEECLAEEIILAANNDVKSFAVSQKEEIERIAKGAR
ncbi:MAG: 30S ribosomal protein S7 [Candidatus Hadarchaeales archaeon]